ncbi:MAG: PglZ domain-containing protein [Methyloprofundus sp.]|nr:PglZ domain-containing protein [Methyloprofundus sp.]
MAIILIVDRFGIDREDALCVEACENAINTARRQIDQHLETANASVLRVRLNSAALFKRFSDYEGLKGVLPTQQLLPRILLTQTLKTELPDWLTDELIVNIGLLENSQTLEVSSATAFEENLLKICDTDLLSGDIKIFIKALAKQNEQFLQLLNIEAVQSCFKKHLVLGLSLNDEVAVLLVNELLKTNSINHFLSNVAYQQHLQLLRTFIGEYQLNQALPAKNLPESLLHALPMLPLAEGNANGLAEKFISALQTIERRIFNQELLPEALCHGLIDWPLLLTELSELIETNRELICAELLAKLAGFKSEQSQTLLSQLQQRTRGYPLLDRNASVNETLAWSEDYFDYCRSLFLDKQTPDEAVNISFSEWLLSQPARVSRLPNNWRYCAAQVEAYLKEAYIVVVIMADALSALNQDIVLAELAGLNHLNLQHDYLFAPLPTLTEVGKMAVLTGLENDAQQGSSQTDILQNHYQNYLPDKDSLKVVKSWADSSERLNKDTQLVVLFENRLDERLHDCVSFSKHRDDIKPIIKQIKRSIEGWRKDAASLNKEIAFFMTADHGMTVTSELYQGKALGKVKERVFKGAQFFDNQPEFVWINHYAVPKKRWRLTDDALLTHGGLTPEEVIIPFISLTSNTPQPSNTPLEINLSKNCTNQGDKVWQIECILNTNTDVSNIQITLNSPFKGKEQLDSLRANKTQALKLNFSSEHQQEGLIEIQLHLSYIRSDGGHEENEKLFSIEFPSTLIEKDTATQSFEDMF